MASEKGMFKDQDRSTKEHQEMCAWFNDDRNASTFVRYELRDCQQGVEIELEKTVRSPSGFLFGFADVVLSYVTDQGTAHKVLIEAKSSISDFGACLRQIRAYQEYLSGITRTCLVHSDSRYEKDDKLDRFFPRQDIFVFSFPEIQRFLDEERKGEPPLANGKHPASCCGIHVSTEREWWSFDFFVSIPDRREGQNKYDLLNTGDLYGEKEKFMRMIRLLGVPWEGEDDVTSISPGDISIDCILDLETKPSCYVGGVQPVIRCITRGEDSLELEIECEDSLPWRV